MIGNLALIESVFRTNELVQTEMMRECAKKNRIDTWRCQRPSLGIIFVK